MRFRNSVDAIITLAASLLVTNLTAAENHVARSASGASLVRHTTTPVQVDPDKGYFVEHIGDGLYWIVDFAYQGMFLISGEGVIVVDAPPSLAPKYKQAIAEVTDEPITHIVYSHMHKDHIGAADQFPPDAQIIAHIDAAEHIALKEDPGRPVPTVTFKDKYELRVGNQALDIVYIGAFHSVGDVIIHAPRQKVIMAVDFLSPGAAPFTRFVGARDLNQHIAAHDKLLAFDFEYLISGHSKLLGTPDHVKLNKEFVVDLMAISSAALEATSYQQIASQFDRDAGDAVIYQSYKNALAQTCAKSAIENWREKLSDVEVFAESDCDTMLLHLMID